MRCPYHCNRLIFGIPALFLNVSPAPSNWLLISTIPTLSLMILYAFNRGLQCANKLVTQGSHVCFRCIYICPTSPPCLCDAASAKLTTYSCGFALQHISSVFSPWFFFATEDLLKANSGLMQRAKEKGKEILMLCLFRTFFSLSFSPIFPPLSHSQSSD